MGLQVEKLEHNMVKLTLDTTAEELEGALAAAYQKQKGSIQIPGFRKGKVPRQMIEKMYGPEVFYEEAANSLIETVYEREITAATDLEVASQPELGDVNIKKGEPFSFTVTVAVKPPVELGTYKGVKVAKIDVEVTEDDITAAIDKEREKNSRTITVSDRAVKDGDMIRLDFDGYVDDVAFEGGHGTDYPLTIGSGSFIPGFEDQLIGANVGEEVTVNVTFPEEYQEKSLAGKAAKFICKVNEITEKELPEVNDEFAAEVSEYETLAEYKDYLKKNLEEEKKASARREKEEAAVKAIVAEAQMDIPEAMINTEARGLANNYAQRLAQQGLSIEQYFQFTGLSMDKLLEQLKPQAEDTIKSRLVLEAVAKAENIEATDADFEEELKKLAESYQLEVDKMKELINDTAADEIKKDIVIQKAVDFVRDNAVEE